jgi:hypothetical protein
MGGDNSNFHQMLRHDDCGLLLHTDKSMNGHSRLNEGTVEEYIEDLRY